MEKVFFLHSIDVDNKISLIPYPLIEEGQEHGNGLGRVSENSDRADGGGDAAAVT